MKKLKEKWKVSWLQFAFIFCTFALGGSLCGFAARKLLGLFDMEQGFFYYLLYFIVLTIFWPLAVIVVSIPFGQFSFFKNYITKLFNRLFDK
ncbi:MAG: hypothetical protein NTZ59_04875 [Bacteroidetes bacterium]|jgi:hypothetical protein|nr:hypothetical protein [Bacteroidota bacterium]